MVGDTVDASESSKPASMDRSLPPTEASMAAATSSVSSSARSRAERIRSTSSSRLAICPAGSPRPWQPQALGCGSPACAETSKPRSSWVGVEASEADESFGTVLARRQGAKVRPHVTQAAVGGERRPGGPVSGADHYLIVVGAGAGGMAAARAAAGRGARAPIAHMVCSGDSTFIAAKARYPLLIASIAIQLTIEMVNTAQNRMAHLMIQGSIGRPRCPAYVAAAVNPHMVNPPMARMFSVIHC